MANHQLTSVVRRTTRARAIVAVVAGFFALGAALLVLPRTAEAAQQAPALQTQATTCEDNGYGCPTSSTQGTISPSCSLSTNSAAPGTKVTATLTGVPVGTEATLLFDGTQVGKETATADGEGETALALRPLVGHLAAAAPVQDASGGVVMTFTVPDVAASKGHSVVFSGAGFSCDATGGVGFEILAAAVERPGGGSLSNTGMNVAIYLAVALALIIGGAQLVRSARARRRRIARAHHRSHAHRSHRVSR